MKITYTKHAELKFKILGEHGCLITKKQIQNTIEKVTSIKRGKKDRLIAQKPIDETHMLR